MADAPNPLQGLPISIQGLVEAGAFVGTAVVAVLGYLKPKAVAAPDAGADKVISQAIIAPLSDANVARQILESTTRNETYSHDILKAAEDIQDEQGRVRQALKRTEELGDDQVTALRAVRSALNAVEDALRLRTKS